MKACIVVSILFATSICSATIRKIVFPGASQTAAQAVDGRFICGSYVIGTQNITHGFLFDGSHFRTLDPPNSNFTIPSGVLNSNGNAIVVGSFNDKITNHFHGFIWQNGKFTIYNFPGAALTGLDGIDHAGHIVGSHVGPNSANVFERTVTSSTIIRIIAFPGASQTFTGGVDGRFVAGTYLRQDQLDHGFLFNGSTYKNIDPPGSHQTFVNGVLNFLGHRVLVGAFATTLSSPLHGFVYLDGTYFRYDFPNATRTTLNGIDHSGHIVGSQSGRSGSTGFELSP
jgi:hypothetical protein